ncbi:MAG: hypothetical protein AB7Q16_07050 [Vicinamibacterales bacterium]
MAPHLPFSTLLDALRAKGMRIGVDDYLAFARLLERFDDTDLGLLRDAAAALLATSPDEIALVKRTFDDLFIPHEAAAPPPPEKRRWLRRLRDPRAWWAAGALVAVMAGAGTWLAWIMATPPPALPPKPPVFLTPLPGPATAFDPRDTMSPGALPEPAPLPAPPVRSNWWLAVAAGLLAVAAVILAIQIPRVNRAHRRWIERTWRQIRAGLPGPSHFTLRPPGALRWLDRRDVEDAATVLGRAFTTGLLSHRLRIAATVQATVRGGLVPRFVFQESTATGTLLLLQDLAPEMQLWRDKVADLLTSLARQGIAVERWFFEETPAMVSAERHGERIALEALGRRRESGVLVLSTGAGLARPVDEEDRAWIATLRRWSRRSWLNPVTDPSTWRPELSRLPINVWPMTGPGLLEAAADLAVDPEVRDRRRAAPRPSGQAVLGDDVERLERLIAVAGTPSVELVEALRQRFVPDVPEDTILHVLPGAAYKSPDEIRLAPDEVRRLLADERRDNPGRERAVRQFVLGLLRAQRPPAGSLADHRWRLAVARQEVALAGIEGTRNADAEAELRSLAEGPLWDEAGEAAAEVLVPSGWRQSVARGAGSASGPPARLPKGGAVARQSWRWLSPRPMDYALAGLVAMLLVAALDRVGAFDGRAIEHRDRAYELAFEPGDGLGETAGRLRLRFGSDPAGAPAQVRLFRDGEPFGAVITVPGSGFADQRLAYADSGHNYQARAALPAGNLALSNAVPVPAMGQLASLNIDVSPWATVRVLEEATRLPASVGTFETPFVVTLPEGRYVLELVHPDLGRAEHLVEVVQGVPRQLHYVMPGFNAEEAARQLLSGAASKPRS